MSILQEASAAFYLEDLEPGDVEHADEVLALVLGVQRLVDARHEPREHARVQRLRQRLHGELHLQPDIQI